MNSYERVLIIWNHVFCIVEHLQQAQNPGSEIVEAVGSWRIGSEKFLKC